MDDVKYIKSFSKGQITIPKDIRDYLGLQDEFWLKVSVEKGTIIAEPVLHSTDHASYLQKLKNITGDWFQPDELTANRLEVEEKLHSRSL